MKIAEITVLKNLTPIEIEENPSNETLEFLHDLIHQTTFAEEVKNKRKQFGIPENGKDINDILGKNITDLGDTLLASILAFGNILSSKLVLTDDYSLQMALLIIYNAAFEMTKIEKPVEPTIEYLFGRQNISNRLWDFDREVGAILVPFTASKNKIKTWIDENWEYMEKQSLDNLTDNKFIKRVHKNLLEEEAIADLREQGKTYPEIVKIMQDRFPEREWKETTVKKMHVDAQQRINLQKRHQ